MIATASPLREQLFELHLVGRETTDAVGELFRSHRVLVVLPAEAGFVEWCWRVAAGAVVVERARHCRARGLELRQQLRRDRQAVAAGERQHLAGVAEAGAHHHGVVAVAPVVAPDARDRQDARVVLRRGRRWRALGQVPVEDAADEGRDQEHARFRARDRLREREQQGEIAVDAFALELPRGADPFPRRRDLDQQAFAADAPGW
jgi:hypothetical protein